jgi:hypothetical protein
MFTGPGLLAEYAKCPTIVNFTPPSGCNVSNNNISTIILPPLNIVAKE